MKEILVVLLLGIVAVSAFATGEAEPDAEEQVTLSYTTWMTKGEDKPGIEAFMAANPNIVVEDEMLEGGRYPELMRTRVLSGDVPDVMMIMAGMVTDYGREGYLADISDTAVIQNIQSQVPSLMDFTTRDGATLAVNITGARLGHHWYNKKLFDDLGLTAPTNVDELEAVMQALLDAGKDPMLFGGTDRWTYQFAWRWFLNDQVQTAVESTGYYDLKEALYNGVLPSEVYRTTYEYFEKWADAGYIVQASNSTSWPESSQVFADGNVGIFPQGPWVAGLPEILEADPEVFELGVFLAPNTAPFEGKTWFPQTMDRFLAVSASTESPDEALALFDFLTAEPQLVEYLERQALTTNLPIEYELPQILLDWIGMTTGPTTDAPPAVFPEAPGFTNELNNALSNVLAGQSAEEALEALDAFYADNRDGIQL